MILDTYGGHIAGITTSVLWTATALLFTAASKRLGPTAVNAWRIVLAIILLAITHRLRLGTWIPDVMVRQVVFLALSGVVGLSLGDQALFTALIDIGPRHTTLIMATAPLFAVFFGWIALGETLQGLAWLGIMVTIGGVTWVVLERPPATGKIITAHRLRGIMLAFVAAACQAGGLWLSKEGMGHGWLPEGERLDPQSATLVRMVFAGLGMLPIVAIHAYRERNQRISGSLPSRQRSYRWGLIFTALGAVAGPYLGVWMSLIASDRVPLGIAQTLCSLPPVFILPFVVIIYKEPISPRAVLGAVMAVAGSALLFVQSG